MKALMKSLHFTSSTWVLLMNATFFPFLLAYRFLLSRSLSLTRMHTLSHTLALSLTQACTYTLALSRTSPTNLSLLKFCCVFFTSFGLRRFSCFSFCSFSFLSYLNLLSLSRCSPIFHPQSVYSFFSHFSTCCLSLSLSISNSFYLSCSILLFSQST